MNKRENIARLSDELSKLLDQIVLVDLHVDDKQEKKRNIISLSGALTENIKLLNRVSLQIVNLDKSQDTNFEKLLEKYIKAQAKCLKQSIYISIKLPEFNQNNQLLEDLKIAVHNTKNAIRLLFPNQTYESVMKKYFNGSTDDVAAAIDSSHVGRSVTDDIEQVIIRRESSIKSIDRKTITPKNVNDPVDQEGNTILHIAVLNGDESMISFLLKQPNIQIDVTNSAGETPLDLAARKLSNAIELVKRNSASQMNPMENPRDKPNRIVKLLKQKPEIAQKTQANVKKDSAVLTGVKNFFGWDKFVKYFDFKKNPIVHSLACDSLSFRMMLVVAINRNFADVVVDDKNGYKDLPITFRKIANPLAAINALLEFAKLSYGKLIDLALTGKSVKNIPSSRAAIVFKILLMLPIIATQVLLHFPKQIIDSITTFPKNIINYISNKRHARSDEDIEMVEKSDNSDRNRQSTSVLRSRIGTVRNTSEHVNELSTTVQNNPTNKSTFFHRLFSSTNKKRDLSTENKIESNSDAKRVKRSRKK